MRAGIDDHERERLLDAIYRRYHYDFRGYAPASMHRRLAQARSGLAADSIAELEERILDDADAFARLLDYLTVQVSDLFRDAAYWQALREHVLPFLDTFPWARVWIAGCSQGEEVYSMAILLHEAGLLERTLLYATDVNPAALRHAEAGVYDLDRIAAFSEAYLAAGGRGSLSDYYTAAYGRAVFDKALRRNVVFSDHSLTTDGVFAEVQLVSCRNVLIYFDRALQDRTVGLLRDSLSHRGWLGLGSRETLRFGAHADAFEEVVPPARLYRRRRLGDAR